MPNVARWFAASTLLLLLPAVTAATRAGPRLVAAGDVSPRQDSLTATVRYVRDGGIDVITGVQLNLRLTHIAVDAGVAIRKEGRSVALDALEAGDLVTVHFRETSQGKVAEDIVVHPAVRDGGR